MEQAPPAIDTAPQPPGSNTRAVLERADFSRILTALVQRGYQVVGPTVRDGAIIFDEIASDVDLPIGWTDEQDGGKYRLKRMPPGKHVPLRAQVTVEFGRPLNMGDLAVQGQGSRPHERIVSALREQLVALQKSAAPSLTRNTQEQSSLIGHPQ